MPGELTWDHFCLESSEVMGQSLASREGSSCTFQLASQESRPSALIWQRQKAGSRASCTKYFPASSHCPGTVSCDSPDHCPRICNTHRGLHLNCMLFSANQITALAVAWAQTWQRLQQRDLESVELHVVLGASGHDVWLLSSIASSSQALSAASLHIMAPLVSFTPAP